MLNRYSLHASDTPSSLRREEGRIGHGPGKETLTESLLRQDESGAGRSESSGSGPVVAGERKTQPKPPDPATAGSDGTAPASPPAPRPQTSGATPDPKAAGGEMGSVGRQGRSESGEQGGNSGGGGTGGGSTAPAGGPAGAPGGAGHVSPIITSRTMKTAGDGSADSRTTVGVGETVTFTSNVAGTWSASDGSIPANSTGKSFIWVAGDVPATSVRIVLNDPHGHAATLTLAVVKPDRLAFTNAASQNGDYDARDAGTGMFCQVRIHPTNVSFGALQMREVPGDASNISGHYLTHGMPHFHKAGGPANWHAINDDNVHSVQDDAHSANEEPPWSDGAYDWVIPNKYRVGSAGTEHDIATTTQTFRLRGSDGNLTITKAGATSTRTPPPKVSAGSSASGTAKSSWWPF